jgi:hypothetical protein
MKKPALLFFQVLQSIRFMLFVVISVTILSSDLVMSGEIGGMVNNPGNFTITAIQPDSENGQIVVTFSKPCSALKLKDSLKIYPPIELDWEKSSASADRLQGTIFGEFKAGESYAIFLPDNVNCEGNLYAPSVKTFKMPDRQGKIAFIGEETAIERNSRQMLHTSLLNVNSFVFQGVRIPPLLLPVAMNEIKSNAPFETIKQNLARNNQIMNEALKDASEVSDFLGQISEDKQIFFPSSEKNETQIFSIPLSFRTDKEKGAFELVQLTAQEGATAASPIKLFRITDIGLAYKRSDNSLLLWATSLNTGQPLNGAAIIAFTNNNAIAIFGDTDDTGVLALRNGEIKPQISLTTGAKKDDVLLLKDIAYIAAVTQDDLSFIATSEDGNVKPDWVEQVKRKDDTGKENTPLKGYAFTERGIYRPQDKVYFKGTVRQYRDGVIIPPSDIEPTFEIVDSKGEKVFEQKLPLSAFGTANGVFQTQSFSHLGSYTLTMKYGTGEKDVATAVFRVEEFKPPRHLTQIAFKRQKKEDPSYINMKKEADFLECQITGKYYAGGPVKHGKARWKVYFTGTNYKPGDFPDYTFGNVMEAQQKLLESGESMLDEKGALTVTIPLSEEIVSGAYGIEFVATVVDFDGRASTESAVYQNEPPYLVGISAHDETIMAGETQTVRVVTVNQKGEKITGGSLEAQILQKDWIYIEKRNEEGDVYWDSEDVWRKQSNSALALDNGAAKFEFDVLYSGDYYLKFFYTAEDGQTYTSTTRYVVEGAFYGYDYESKDRKFQKLSMTPEKKTYGLNDKIVVHLDPHKKISHVLMTIEREDIIEQQVIPWDEKQKTITVDVKDLYVPNVYISVLATVARGEFPVYTEQFDSGAPDFLYGVVNIDIKKDPKRLDVTLNEGATSLKAKPGEEFTVTLTVKDENGQGVESEVAVAAVDEAVLALTGYQTPDLETLARFNAFLSVFTGDMRAELLKQTPYKLVSQKALTGGDGDDKGHAGVNVRKNFNPVAYFNPTVLTDKNGAATVTFKLPDSMTNYRIFAVACDRTSQFDSSAVSLTVVKDFYLEAGLPRFFTKGDRFNFFVSAFNKTTQYGDVRLAVKSDPQLKLATEDKAYSVGVYDREIIPLSGEALEVGQAKILFTGAFNDKSDLVEETIPVRSGALLWRDALFGTVKQDSAAIAYPLPQGLDKNAWSALNPDDVQVVLTVSGSPFLRMSRGFNYLLEYPYGCVEQTSSGVLPLAALRDLVNQGAIPTITPEQTDKFLTKGIERLFSMQTDSGGFGYWPGDSYPDRWGTIYALSALSFAKLSGVPLPEEKLTKALDYLTEELKGEINKATSGGDLFKAYGAYILSLNGALDQTLFNGVYSGFSQMSKQAALLTLMSAKNGGFLTDAELVKQTKIALLNASPAQGQHYEGFYAPYRESAIALIAGSMIAPEDPLTGKAAAQLLAGMNPQGIWTSTSDTGWSLIALGKYFKKTVFSDSMIEAKLTQGANVQTMSLKPTEFQKIELDAKAFIQNPDFSLTASHDLIYMLSVTLPRADYAAKGHSNGFRLSKKIVNMDGSDAIKIGDVVKVQLTIEVERNNSQYLVLDDPLPAGLVAINTALKTEEKVEDDTSKDGNYWNDWDFDSNTYRFTPNYFEMRDDRVLVFKDSAWSGTYQFTYYARAVCEGEFILPSSKVQLMYSPEVVAYNPTSKLKISAR